MSQNQDYVVLARKYRPQHLDELVGQDALVRTLKNAFKTGRIAHAFMLTGIRGTGKTTTARIIAKAVNYKGPDGKGEPTAGPTDDCPICQAIAKGNHPDVIEIDAASHTGVDNIRDLTDGIYYAPADARYKVYIIDEVHMLSKGAFNALLKTLEEPPAHAKFIFATTEIRKVPVTILSRCQRFDTARVSADALARYYGEICEKENVKAEPAALQMIGRLAQGSVRDGLSLLDQAIALSDETLVPETIQSMLGLPSHALMITLFEALMKGDVAKAMEQGAKLYKNGADALAVLRDLIDIIHLVTKEKAAPNVQETIVGLVSVEDRTSLARIAENIPMAALGHAWQIALKGVEDVQKADNPQAALEMIFVRISYGVQAPDPNKLFKQLCDQSVTINNPVSKSDVKSHLEGVISGTKENYYSDLPVQSTQNTVPAVQSQPVQPKITSLEQFVDILEDLGEMAIASQIRHYIHPVQMQAGILECRLAENAPKTVTQAVQKALKNITGEKWLISLVSEGGAPTLQEQDVARKSIQTDKIRQSPLVKKALELWPGATVDVL